VSFSVNIPKKDRIVSDMDMHFQQYFVEKAEFVCYDAKNILMLDCIFNGKGVGK